MPVFDVELTYHIPLTRKAVVQVEAVDQDDAAATVKARLKDRNLTYEQIEERFGWEEPKQGGGYIEVRYTIEQIRRMSQNLRQP